MAMRQVAPIVVLVMAAACAGAPASPSPDSKGLTPPILDVRCTAGAGLHCTASLFGEGDVTERASWSAAESFRTAMDRPVPSSAAVDFPARGEARVLRARNVYIRADYTSPTWGALRSIAPHAYAVDPAVPPVPLAYLTGTVFVAGTLTPLPDVTVEVVDGESQGKQSATIVNGSYMLEFLRLSAPFTVRGSKPGFQPEVKTHPGIVDNPLGYPDNTALHFALSASQ